MADSITVKVRAQGTKGERGGPVKLRGGPRGAFLAGATLLMLSGCMADPAMPSPSPTPSSSASETPQCCPSQFTAIGFHMLDWPNTTTIWCFQGYACKWSFEVRMYFEVGELHRYYFHLAPDVPCVREYERVEAGSRESYVRNNQTLIASDCVVPVGRYSLNLTQLEGSRPSLRDDVTVRVLAPSSWAAPLGARAESVRRFDVTRPAEPR